MKQRSNQRPFLFDLREAGEMRIRSCSTGLPVEFTTRDFGGGDDKFVSQREFLTSEFWNKYTLIFSAQFYYESNHLWEWNGHYFPDRYENTYSGHQQKQSAIIFFQTELFELLWIAMAVTALVTHGMMVKWEKYIC